MSGNVASKSNEASLDRYASLEGARCLMAWWVVFSHLFRRAGITREDLFWPFDVLYGGTQAVSVFMILSGFVITHLITRREERYSDYIVRRFLRLWPTATVCLVGYLALSWGIGLQNQAIQSDRFAGYLVAHLTLLHGVIPNEVLPGVAMAFLRPAWSISLEWQFYLVAPLLLRWVRRPGWPLLILLLVLPILTDQRTTLFLPGSEWTFDGGAFLPINLRFFLVGMISYQILSYLPRQISTPVAWIAAVGVFLLTRSYPLAVWTLIFASLRSPAIESVLASRPLVSLGRVSYSTYLVHMLVLRFLEVQVGLEWLGRGWALFAFLAATGIPATILASHLLYRFVEVPGMRLGKRIVAIRHRRAAAET